MRALLQRVKEACVRVNSAEIAAIKTGILVFLGISAQDNDKDIEYIVNKTLNMRMFPDERANMNKSVVDVSGEILLISQFTLYADTRKGRRPSFNNAAPSEAAAVLFEQSLQVFSRSYGRVKSGIFQATMDVELVNDGPVTLMLDSAD